MVTQSSTSSWTISAGRTMQYPKGALILPGGDSLPQSTTVVDERGRMTQRYIPSGTWMTTSYKLWKDFVSGKNIPTHKVFKAIFCEQLWYIIEP